MKLFAILLFFIPFLVHSQIDFDNVKSTAKQQHKHILLNFSGSDWCGPCIVFTKDFLGSAEYKSFEAANLVFVNADFPRRKKNQLPAEAQKSNEALAERYNPKGIFPYTILLDATGKVVKAWEGKPAETPSEWLSELKSSCN